MAELTFIFNQISKVIMCSEKDLFNTAVEKTVEWAKCYLDNDDAFSVGGIYWGVTVADRYTTCCTAVGNRPSVAFTVFQKHCFRRRFYRSVT